MSTRGTHSGEGAGNEKVLVLKDVEVHIPLKGMIDIAEEKGRLGKEIESCRSEIARIEGLLGNESFLAKAPPAVVDRERQKLHERRDTLGRLEEKLAALG